MDNIKYTKKVEDVIRLSMEEASRLGNNKVGVEHLLLGIIRDADGTAIDLLKKFNVDLGLLKKKLEDSVRGEDTVDVNENLEFETSASTILKFSQLEARRLGNDVFDTIHILLAIVHYSNNKASEILNGENITYQKMIDSIENTNDNKTVNSFNDSDEDDEEDFFSSNDEIQHNGDNHVNTAQTANLKTPNLDAMGVDMTKEAALGKYDAMVGRETEVKRMIQILSRRKKNNPVLIGEPGVGKSAIVEGLAQKIVNKQTSRCLLNKRIVSLDMSSIVAGTKYRGQFEEKIKNILSELSKNPDIILFIDEIHTIVGAGNSQGGLDAANLLKPALARGTIQCIGATTLKEYRDSIEKDGALERRFQKIIVDPTTKDETIQILNNIKDKYEEHHNVRYTEDALKTCVNLTERYISDRAFPDKAIDALDEAGSMKHVLDQKVPESIEKLENEIAAAQKGKREAVETQNYELAAGMRDQETKLMEKLAVEKQKWETSLKNNPQTVDEDDIRSVVSMMSGVPLQRIGKNESEVLKNLKERLQGKVIGQDDAISKVVKAIRRNRLGLKDPNRPIGSFLFLGPTGVGKTHLANMLSDEMFGSKDSLIRIDMSEYMEKIAITRLVGAAPGYVGYEEGGQLTEKVRRKPYSIILLDEIEKAHHDVFNLLLQMMDEGRLTDSFGRTVDFRNTIIIMTSNVGSRQLKEFGTGIGFSSFSPEVEADKAKGVINKELNKTFSPEFLNRIDDIITFEQLDKNSIFKIIDLELNKVYSRVQSLGYKLTIKEEAKNFIAEKGYDKQFGARPLKRAVQKYVEDVLAEVLLDNEDISAGDEIIIDVNDNKTDVKHYVIHQNNVVTL